MKIVLTGARGFIGRNIYESWKEKYDILAPSHEELDLTDDVAVRTYLSSASPDVIIHAANVNKFAHPEKSSVVIEANLRMFFNLANCTEYYGKLLYFGSGAEYDQRHYIPRMPESYFGTHIPADDYGFSKYIMSKAAETSCNLFNLRLFGVFGKYEEWKRRFISNLIYLYLTGQPMQMGPNMYFDYLYIQDLMPILEWFLYHDPRYHTYNVCSGREIDLYSLGCMICESFNQDPAILQKKSGWKLAYTGDNSRLRDEMGGNYVLTPMKTAINELIEYYKQNGSILWPSEMHQKTTGIN
ncbi:NAD-dependent epimerase/dehydratase family protein [Candidatus Agathobaculum pullicola]|uniref:NAD-dependent epimerase/dehydratase family protein n=1 Tax=Candidatus Agathobaculum pullicola TaxID=2838426 RepID=UPI003F8E0E87